MKLRTTHIATMLVGVAVIGAAAIVIVQNGNARRTVSADVAVGTASLKVGSATSKVGDEFTIDLSLDTGSNSANNQTSGIDAILAYDPNVLTPIDADPQIAGVQIVPGVLFELVQANKVDTTLGQISFSAGQQTTGQPVTAHGEVVATARFKAIAVGRSPLRLSFTSGLTSDSNVIQPKTGRDLLNRVQDGIVTVE